MTNTVPSIFPGGSPSALVNAQEANRQRENNTQERLGACRIRRSSIEQLFDLLQCGSSFVEVFSTLLLFARYEISLRVVAKLKPTSDQHFTVTHGPCVPHVLFAHIQ